MDVSVVRAEIKSWERQFRKQHARDPTVQEIKDHPAIAEKYKLYKKLSKQGTAIPADRPSTPPRARQPRPSTSSILSQPRAVKTEAPLLTSNPFSPVKNKGKCKASPSVPQSFPVSPSSSRANPFATPSKAKSKPRVPRRDLSPDPFPLIHPLQPAVSHASTIVSHRAPTQNTLSDFNTPRKHNAVFRARKRLRGEHVSPSPVKEKKARVVSQSTATFPRRSSIHLDSGHISGGEADGPGARAFEDAEEAEFFLGDSPVKPRTGGKQFMLLFDEVAMTTQDVNAHLPRQTSSRTKSTNTGVSLFGRQTQDKKSRVLSPDDDDNMDWDWDHGGAAGSQKIKALDLSLNGEAGRTQPARKGFPRAALPGKDDLWSATGPSKLTSSAGMSTVNGIKGGLSKKRSLPGDGMDVDEQAVKKTLTQSVLLPPSPPQDASKARYSDAGKGRGGQAANRKKAKILADMAGDDEDDESLGDEDGMQVNEVAWSWNAHIQGHIPDGKEDLLAAPDSEPEFDPLLYRPTPATATSHSAVDERFEVNLPDDLRRVLALSPRVKDDTEDRMVRGLLYGRREGHYDAERGGEIWDVGEESGSEGEEDWEGEPVPWEVGEL